MESFEIAQGEFEYELVEISWSLDYDFSQMPHAMYVADEGELPGQKEARSEIEYDEDGIPMGGSMEETHDKIQYGISSYDPQKPLVDPMLQINTKGAPLCMRGVRAGSMLFGLYSFCDLIRPTSRAGARRMSQRSTICTPLESTYKMILL